MHRATFVWPHLDYGDIIYDNFSNATFSQMIESVEYNAALAITDAISICCPSREKLYHELCFESLHDRQWRRKLFVFIMKSGTIIVQSTYSPA